MPFQITPEAAQFIHEKLVERATPSAYLRVGVQGSGCNGYKYCLEWHDEPPNDRDSTFQQDGVCVVVDKKSLLFLNQAQLTLEKKLLRCGLVITNPLEANRCGCGASVAFKDK